MPDADLKTRAETPARLRVLLVEDDEPCAILADSALKMFGCVVEWLSNGEAAVEIAAQVEFDLIFMDFHLPGLDGVSATRCIREFEKESGRIPIPIIGVTASAMPHEREACLKSGMDHVLLKPFRLEELQDLLVKWGRARRP